MATELCEMDQGIAAPMQSADSGSSSSDSPIVHTLAVIVPIYNEQATVAELLRRLEQQSVVSQIIIVNDGSTDNTREELTTWEASRSAANPVVIIHHETNRGKGRAIRTGLEHVTCSHVLIQDADLEYDPDDIAKLWQVVQADQADVVYGSRYLNLDTAKPRRRVLEAGIGFLNLVVRLLCGIRLTDEATCYKLFSTEDLRRMQLRCERFEFCPEATAKAANLGRRFTEVQISYTARGRAQGKKLRLSDGLAALRVLVQMYWWTAERVPGGSRTTVGLPHLQRRSKKC